LGAAPELFAGCCRHLGRAFCFTNRRMWTGTYQFALDQLPARCPGNSAWENALSVSTFTEATPLQPQGEVGTPASFCIPISFGSGEQTGSTEPARHIAEYSIETSSVEGGESSRLPRRCRQTLYPTRLSCIAR